MISRNLLSSFSIIAVVLLCLVAGSTHAATNGNNSNSNKNNKNNATTTTLGLTAPHSKSSQTPIRLYDAQRRCHSHGSKRLDPAKLGMKSRRLPVEVKEMPVSPSRRRVMGGTGMVNVPVQFNIICPKTGKNTNNCPGENSLRMQVDMLNLGYNDLAISFDIVGFRYAFSDAWYRAEVGGDELSEDAAAILQQLHRGDKRTLNVFFKTNLDKQGSLGLTVNFPEDVKARPAWSDAIFIETRTLPGTSDDRFRGFNGGKTLVHETGHWFGVYHPTTDRCDQKDIRYGIKDDTPAVTSLQFDCKPVSTCPGQTARVDNFMTYVPDKCMNKFTKGQAQQMHFAYRKYRK